MHIQLAIAKKKQNIYMTARVRGSTIIVNPYFHYCRILITSKSAQPKVHSYCFRYCTTAVNTILTENLEMFRVVVSTRSRLHTLQINLNMLFDPVTYYRET